MQQGTLDIVSPGTAVSLHGLFRERVARTPKAIAYRYFDHTAQQWMELSWEQTYDHIEKIRAALSKEDIEAGDRVAIMLRNCPQWIMFEQAALSLGLVVVPLYTNDRAENVAYVLQDAGAKVLLVEGQETLDILEPISPQLQGLVRLVTLQECEPNVIYPRMMSLQAWEREGAREGSDQLALASPQPGDLATIVYTSGTTGRPKGVMLSHRNILSNAHSALPSFPIYREDVLLSFLPLSHMLERTLGYYIPVMCGSTVAFARSVQDLGEDLLTQRPTILISVPRIYERVYNKIMAGLEEKPPLARKLFHATVEAGWRRFNGGSGGLAWPILKRVVADKVLDKLGGRLRLAICGGAPLSPKVAKLFLGLGLNLVQGYGLTEISPMVSGNPIDDNDPASVGIAFDGVEVRIGEDDELLVRSEAVMMGYWHNPEATREVIDEEGWLHTGDKARIENNHIYITGRLKDIIVLSNGEKVPPADMEMAIALDPLIDQVLVIGEGRPYLTALVVLDKKHWSVEACKLGLDPEDPQALQDEEARQMVCEHIKQRLHDFPGYADIRAVALTLEPWTIDNEALTPTLKLRRRVIIERNADLIEQLYAGH
ncbi:MAG TPA: long-chain fatty acid--CoA ligase [Gammaproteobacteria bacterium]|nr:long-chain fatty acid--CoA ligase [Gammaproteobacteria bacterium]